MTNFSQIAVSSFAFFCLIACSEKHSMEDSYALAERNAREAELAEAEMAKQTNAIEDEPEMSEGPEADTRTAKRATGGIPSEAKNEVIDQRAHSAANSAANSEAESAANSVADSGQESAREKRIKAQVEQRRIRNEARSKAVPQRVAQSPEVKPTEKSKVFDDSEMRSISKTTQQASSTKKIDVKSRAGANDLNRRESVSKSMSPESVRVKRVASGKQKASDQRQREPASANRIAGRSSVTQYVVQLGAFRIKENAERFYSRLTKQGYPVIIQPMNHSKNGQLYLVRLRPTRLRAEAEGWVVKLRTKSEVSSQLLVISEQN